jgi:hypothetical protein
MSTLLAQLVWWDAGTIASLAAAWECANRRPLKTMKPSQLRALLAQGKEAAKVEDYEQRLREWLYRISEGQEQPAEGTKPRWASKKLIEATLEAVRNASEEQNTGLSLELRRLLAGTPEDEERFLQIVRLRQARSFVATAVQLAVSMQVLESSPCKHLPN